MVAAHPDSGHRGGGLQHDSNAGSDTALRSAGLAACRVRVRGKEAMHLGVLAPCDYPSGVVVSKPRRGGNEHDCFRRAMDAQSDRVAGIRDGARKLFARGTARTGGDGATVGGRPGLCVHH